MHTRYQSPHTQTSIRICRVSVTTRRYYMNNRLNLIHTSFFQAGEGDCNAHDITHSSILYTGATATSSHYSSVTMVARDIPGDTPRTLERYKPNSNVFPPCFALSQNNSNTSNLTTKHIETIHLLCLLVSLGN